MLKVYVEAVGLADRLEAVVGKQLTENEKYLILIDGGIKKKIPHSRIVMIEDLSEVIDEEVVSKPQPSMPVEDTVAETPPIAGQRQFTMADLRKRMSEKKTVKVPQEETFQPESTTTVNVIVSGAEEAQFTVKIPENSFVPDSYSPQTSKELAKNNEFRSLWERGAIFDGVPKVVGKNIYIKTKNMASQGAEIGEKMGMMSKLQDLGSFNKPEKAYQTDFSMSMGKGLEAIPHSPFEKPVLLNDIMPPISSDIVVERLNEESGELNENSSKESGDSEKAIGGETSEGNEGVLEESPSS